MDKVWFLHLVLACASVSEMFVRCFVRCFVSVCVCLCGFCLFFPVFVRRGLRREGLHAQWCAVWWKACVCSCFTCVRTARLELTLACSVLQCYAC